MKLLPLLVMLIYLRSIKSAPTRETISDDALQNKRRKVESPLCQLTFSEIKLDWNQAIQTSPFIELRSVCQQRQGTNPKTAIFNYMIIIIQQNPISLAMVVNFEHFPHDGTKSYVVVGAPDVNNVDVSTATPHVQSIFSRSTSPKMLPIPTENSYSALILRDLTNSEIKQFSLYFNLDGDLTARPLTMEQLELIKIKAVDMVVLGKTEKSQHQEFRYFWGIRTTSLYAKSWTHIREEDTTMSLNMCNPDYIGFDSAAFVIKPESPGEDNFCQPSLPIQLNETPEIFRVEQTNAYQTVHKITDVQLQSIRTHVFQPSWIEKCQNRFPKKSKLLEDTSIQNWINFDDQHEDCKFSCKTCKAYLGIGFRPDIKAKAKIFTTGYLSPDIYENGNAIKNHAQSQLHQESTEFDQKLKVSTTKEEVQAAIHDFELKEMDTFNATMNVILITYAEIKSGLSFQTHETIMKAIRKTGANVGSKQHTDDAPPLIAKVLAKSFQKKLLAYLINSDQHFSIMIDSSTSFSMPFLAVYIQVLEDGYPTSHFYSLIHMEQGEAASAMSESFVKQIRTDDELVPGFENYFKSRIVSFSSDGAAVMTGDKNLFKTHLADYVGRDIPNIICLTHKLDSAYKLGIKPDKTLIDQLDDTNRIDWIRIWQLSFFETFEQTLNELYTYYQSRGYKKWMHFLKTAEELDMETKRMKYIWNVRWSESHFRALQAIHQMLYVILEDLSRIRNDNTFDYVSRHKANQHYMRMTDKTYLIVLHDFLDILSTFKVASQKLQESSSTLVGKVQIIHYVLNEMEDLQSHLGTAVKGFLQNVACVNICDEGDCTLNMYDACPEVLINGVTLQNHHDVVMDYAEVRKGLFNNIMASIKKYFSLELLESFDIFNPLLINLKAPAVNLNAFYKVNPSSAKYLVFSNSDDRIKYICKFYRINDEQCDEFRVDWFNIITCLANTGDEALENPVESTRFWPYALTLCSNAWTPVTKKILGYVMVTPYFSSEVERGFSVMSSLKTKGRSRMDKSTLNALMTVKINGPDVESFNVYEYTVEFLKSYARADDNTMNGGKKPAEEKLPSMFAKSRIYK